MAWWRKSGPQDSTIAQYMNDVSFALVRVHLFMLNIQCNANMHLKNPYNVGVIQACIECRPELAGSCEISLYSQYIGIT